MESRTAAEIPEMNQEFGRAPSCYAEWLRWFAYLQDHPPDKECLALLQKGTCSDAEYTIEYLENQLIKTENIMLKRCIGRFRKQLELLLAYGEYEMLYRPFRVLAEQFGGCLFFGELTFMSGEFRTSLSASVKANAADFWNRSVRQIEQICQEGSSTVLEDQLYMIKKIRLFGDREKRNYEQLS